MYSYLNVLQRFYKGESLKNSLITCEEEKNKILDVGKNLWMAFSVTSHIMKKNQKLEIIDSVLEVWS